MKSLANTILVLGALVAQGANADVSAASSGIKIDFQNTKGYQYQRSGGIDGSGGGSVLDCKTPSGKQYYELMDYNDGRRRKLPIDLGPKNLSVSERIEFVLNRLHKINPTRAENYADMVNAFNDNLDLRDKSKFGKTPDVTDEVIPENCERVQVIIQINPELPGDKRFIVNKDIYDKLDRDSETKAGLILHEVAYYEQGMQNARRLRYFNAWLASSSLQNMTLAEYAKLVETALLDKFDIGHGVVCKARSHDLKFNTDGSLLTAASCLERFKGSARLPGIKFGPYLQIAEHFPSLRIDSWMLNRRVGTVDASMFANNATNGMTQFELVDEKVVVGGDIEIIKSGEKFPFMGAQYSFQNSIGYLSQPFRRLTGIPPVLFRLPAINNWVIKTNRAAYDVNQFQCPNSDVIQEDVFISKISETSVHLARICNSYKDADYSKAVILTQEIPR